MSSSQVSGSRTSPLSVVQMAAVFFYLSPRTATRTLFNSENRIRVQIWFTASLYGSPLFNEINSATFLWYRVASGPIPPVVVNIRGEKDPFSTWRILSLYILFFWTPRRGQGPIRWPMYVCMSVCPYVRMYVCNSRPALTNPRNFLIFGMKVGEH